VTHSLGHDPGVRTWEKRGKALRLTISSTSLAVVGSTTGDSEFPCWSGRAVHCAFFLLFLTLFCDFQRVFLLFCFATLTFNHPLAASC
jgi:hypothetical protein